MRRFHLLATGLFTIVGCGDDGVHHLADAPPGGSADAQTGSDAPVVVVTTVTTLARTTSNVPSNSDAPIPGIHVQVINPDLTLGPAGVSDANGKVVFTSPTYVTGSTITAIYPEDDGNQTRIVSFASVPAGANLVFGDHYFTPTYVDSPSTVLTVSWPAVANVTSVTVNTPCNGGSGDGSANLSGTMSVSNDCAGSAMPLEFVASDDSGNIVDTGWIAAAPTGIGSGSGSGSGSAIALGAWDPLATAPNFSVVATGFTAPLSVGQGDEITPYMPVSRYGTEYTFGAGAGIELDGSGNGSAQLITALDGARTTSTLGIFTSADTGSGGGWGAQESFAVGAANATSIAFAPTGLPFLGRTTAVSASEGTFQWFETPGATTHGDVAIANLGWNVTDTASDTTHYYYWTIIAPPPATTQLSWAGYPAVLAPYLPPADTFIQARIRLLDIAAVTSYPEAIALPEWQLTDPYDAMLDGDVARASIVDGGEGGFGKDNRAHGPGATRATGAAKARAKAFAIAHPSSRR